MFSEDGLGLIIILTESDIFEVFTEKIIFLSMLPHE